MRGPIRATFGQAQRAKPFIILPVLHVPAQAHPAKQCFIFAAPMPVGKGSGLVSIRVGALQLPRATSIASPCAGPSVAAVWPPRSAGGP
mmetsp:Transcript_23472/g.59953  ORF Transcript_23472/g.59953 Transcript_23472/m.59953 type:complete len:89 (-) Transcript_23472:801-1067(-)